MREDVQDYIKVLKKNGFYSQQFDFDLADHKKREDDFAKTKTELAATTERAQQIIHQNFSTVFKALLHMKIMRVFIESVLRFGLPSSSKFFMGIIKPEKGCDQKIFAKMT